MRAKSKTKPSPFDNMLQGLGDCLTAESAQRLLDYRVDPESQKIIAQWAEKCSEGTLTPEEHSEYGEVVRLDT